MDREDLDEFIADSLHELAWHKDYPLVPEVGTWCWINGMKEAGFSIDYKGDPIKLWYVFDFCNKKTELTTTITKEEILRGWSQHPKASPKALYNSMYLVINKLHERVEGKFPKWKIPLELSDALFFDRNKKAHKSRELMEKHFLEYFEKYQEGVLSPLDLHNPELHEPRILNNLIRRNVINLSRINEAVAYTQFEEFLLTNVEDTIAFLLEGETIEDEGDVIDENGGPFGYKGISQSDVENYIWGSFLLELAKAKNYPLRDYETDSRFGMLEIACDIGWEIFENASLKMR